MTTKLPPLSEIVAFLEEHGPLPETRPEATTDGLVELYPQLAGVDVTDVAIDGPHGPVPARLYLAERRIGAALVWMHGGAWIGGTLVQPEAHWVGLTLAAAGIPVLSVDYRKALHGLRHPVPLDDVVAAWEWATAELAERIGSASLYLGGASAGANLATGAAVRLRGAGGRMPEGLVLAYPALHAELPEQSEEVRAAAAAVPEGDSVFTNEVYRELTHHYAGDAIGDPTAFPAAGDVTGLPPVCIVDSEHDTLRASSDAFVRQLADAGVEADHSVEAGAVHGHLDQPDRPHGARTLERMASWITARTDGGAR